MDRTVKKLDDVTETYLQNPVKAVEIPADATKKDDKDVKNQPQPQQQQQAMPGMGEVKGMWQQHVGSAKIAWGLLTEDAIEVKGHVQKLAGLVQECYSSTFDEAEKQVNSFIGSHKF